MLVFVGIAGSIYFASATYALIIVALLFIKHESAPAGDTSASVWQNLKEGLAYIRQDRTMLAMVSIEAIPALFGWPYQLLMPIFARDILDVGAPGLGFLMAATGIGSLAGALILAS